MSGAQRALDRDRYLAFEIVDTVRAKLDKETAAALEQRIAEAIRQEIQAESGPNSWDDDD